MEKVDRMQLRARLASGKTPVDLVLKNCKIVNVFNGKIVESDIAIDHGKIIGIGLTIATDKTQIVDMVKQSYNDCKVKKESVLKYDEEMRRCEDILKLLNTTPDITTNVTKDFKELDELKAEVKELKQLLQNVTTVRPEVKIETPSSEEKQIEI